MRTVSDAGGLIELFTVCYLSFHYERTQTPPLHAALWVQLQLGGVYRNHVDELRTLGTFPVFQ